MQDKPTGDNEAGAFHFVDKHRRFRRVTQGSLLTDRHQADTESLVEDGIVDSVPDFDGDHDAQYEYVNDHCRAKS